MGIEFFSSKEAQRLMDLAATPYRPPIIVELQEMIEGEIRAAELVASITGEIDPERIKKIVQMKLDLDSLCLAWADGVIS